MAQKKHSYKSRAARRDEIILTAFGQRVNGKKTFTNSKMAKWMGLSASSKLKAIIEELTADGWLDKEEKIHRNSRMKDGNLLVITKHEYRLSSHALIQLAII